MLGPSLHLHLSTFVNFDHPERALCVCPHLANTFLAFQFIWRPECTLINTDYILFAIIDHRCLYISTPKDLSILHWSDVCKCKNPTSWSQDSQWLPESEVGVAWHSKSPPILQPHLSSLNRTSLLLLRISKKAFTYGPIGRRRSRWTWQIWCAMTYWGAHPSMAR